MAIKKTGRQAWDIIKGTLEEFVQDDCPRKAAALSYYTVFSLPPLLVIIIIIAGLVLDPDRVAGWIHGEAGNLIGPYSAMILFLGAELTQVWAQRHGQGIQPQPGAMRVIREQKAIREPAPPGP
jgi:uncharacterized BrkB/YihY/UPF0761 family membrane protein